MNVIRDAGCLVRRVGQSRKIGLTSVLLGRASLLVTGRRNMRGS
jgi:hypothetical protein